MKTSATTEQHRDVPPKAPSRREEILSTAADLFSSKGYRATAMSEVAGAVGIQKASLYHHVRTKETLLYELSMESMRHMIAAASSVAAAPPGAYLRALIEAHVLSLLRDQSTHATALTELRNLSPEQQQHVVELRDRYDRIFEEAVRAVQKAERRWAGVSAKVVRLAILGMLNWSVFWYARDGEVTPQKLARAFGTIVLGDVHHA